jgi:hypothetical protein
MRNDRTVREKTKRSSGRLKKPGAGNESEGEQQSADGERDFLLAREVKEHG